MYLFTTFLQGILHIGPAWKINHPLFPLLSIVSFNSSHFNINFSILVIMMCLFFLSQQARSLNPKLKYKFSLNKKLGEPLKTRQQDYDALRTSLKFLLRSLYVCVYIICKQKCALSHILEIIYIVYLPISLSSIFDQKIN